MDTDKVQISENLPLFVRSKLTTWECCKMGVIVNNTTKMTRTLCGSMLFLWLESVFTKLLVLILICTCPIPIFGASVKLVSYVSRKYLKSFFQLYKFPTPNYIQNILAWQCPYQRIENVWSQKAI